MGIYSEFQLFRRLSSIYLSSKIERSVYNRRRRKLFDFTEFIRKKLSTKFNEFEDVFIIDSMPLEICKNSRANRSSICKEVECSRPSKGYCASQKMYYFYYYNYYGYKVALIRLNLFC